MKTFKEFVSQDMKPLLEHGADQKTRVLMKFKEEIGELRTGCIKDSTISGERIFVSFDDGDAIWFGAKENGTIFTPYALCDHKVCAPCSPKEMALNVVEFCEKEKYC